MRIAFVSYVFALVVCLAIAVGGVQGAAGCQRAPTKLQPPQVAFVPVMEQQAKE